MPADKCFPSIVLIDNHNACNLRCSMCDHRFMTRSVHKMPEFLYRKVIDEIARENPGARVWEIFFGEPALLRSMAERIAYAKSCGLTDVVLNSNGVLLGARVAKEYIDAGLDWMYVGIDAATEETYQKMRVGGDFHKAIANVLAWREMKDNIFVQFVECDLNRHEKDEFIDFWTARDVRVKVRPMVSWIGLVDNKSERKEQPEPCYWYRNSMSILNSGAVALCACDIHGRYRVGDIIQRTMKEVWQDYHQRLPVACRSCNDWQFASATYVQGEGSCTTS